MPTPVIPAALAPAFRGYNALFNAQYAKTEPLWPNFAMKTPSNSESETFGWMAEIPGVREWVGSRIRHTEKLLGFRLVNQQWELTMQIPETWARWDKLGMFNPKATLMGANAAVKPDLEILNKLVDGFVSTAYDSVAFFGSHTWKGGTWANNDTMALDATNYAIALQAFKEQLGHAGTNGEAPLNINPEITLVCGPALEATARTILNAELIGGGNTNINLNSAKLLVLPYLRDNTGKAGTVQAANYWYLICTNTPGGLMPFILQEEMPWRTREITGDQEWIVFDSGEYVFGTDSSWTTGYGLWQLAWGSTGAG